jgi:hypothetical protein
MESQVSITIGEARDKHRQLQENIALLMLGFTRETGLLIEDLSFILPESGHGLTGVYPENLPSPYASRDIKIRLF